MGKPSHKSYKLYRVVTGHAEDDGEIGDFSKRLVIAVDAKDAMAQVTDLDTHEYFSEVHIVMNLDGVRFPDPN